MRSKKSMGTKKHDLSISRSLPELFTLLILVSLLVGYWKLVVQQDFAVFTSEEEVPGYIQISTEVE